MSLSRGAGLGSIGLSNSSPNLGGSGTEDGSDPTTRFAPGANSAWDFINNYARFKDVYYGPLANTPGWSFTRASTGYAQTAAGVLVPFASGELRRTDKGVLIEGARTNLCLQSQTFDNASWEKTRSSVSADAAVAPDGTTTADKLVEDTTATATHQMSQNITVSLNATCASSVYAKAGERTWLRITEGNGVTASAFFNLSAGTVGTVAGTGTPSAIITALANGWYRCTLVFTASGTTPNSHFQLATGDNGNSYTGDGASGLYIWGAQLEAAAFPSSYIPTTTASATRAADVLTVPVSGIAYPVSLFCEWQWITSTAGSRFTVGVNVNGSDTNRSYLRIASNDTVRAIMSTGGVEQAAVSPGVTSLTGVVYKQAGRFAANDVNCAINGTVGSADTSATDPTAPTIIRFGSTDSGTEQPFGYLRRAALFNRALSDAELQAVTL